MSEFFTDDFRAAGGYDSTISASFQGQLSSAYTSAITTMLTGEEAADWVGYLAKTVNGLDLADALAVKEAVEAGTFTLSGLFAAAQSSTGAADPVDPVPTLTVIVNGEAVVVDLTPILSDLETETWTQTDTTGGGKKAVTTTTYHTREFYTDSQAPEGYSAEWSVEAQPNYLTINLSGGGVSGIVAGQASDYEDNIGGSGTDGKNGAAGTSVSTAAGTTTAGGNGTDGGDGPDAIVVNDPAPYDGIKLVSTGGTANVLLGGSGGNGGDGGDGGSVAVTGNLAGATTVTTTAADGGDGGDGGNGGHAINNGTLSAIIIEGGTDLTILGGDAGAGGTGGEGGSVTVSGNLAGTNKTVVAGDGGDGGDGGAGGATDGAGGDGGDGGSIQAATIGSGLAGNDLTTGDGGDGGDGNTAGDGGDGGDVIVPTAPSSAAIGGSNTDIVFGDGGDGASPGTAGTPSEPVGGNVDVINGVAGSTTSPSVSPIISAFSDRVDVDASTFTGHLTISGSDDDDSFSFGTGGTTVYATTGSDIYTFNNAASETIIYTSPTQSDGSTDTDTINNFEAGTDLIDLQGVYGGTLGFSTTGAASNSVWVDGSGVDTLVYADTDGDAVADMSIIVAGDVALTSADFLL